MRRVLQMRRRIEVWNPRLLRADDRTLVDRRQPAVRPVLDAADRQADRVPERDVGGQFLRLGPETVAEPASDDRMAGDDPTGVECVDRLAVVVHVRVHRPHDGDVVDDPREVRQQFRDVCAAPAVPAELPRRAEDFGTRLGRIVVLDHARERLPIQFSQPRLGVEQVDVARSPLHEERDHRSGLWRMVRCFGFQVEVFRFQVGLAWLGEQALLV